MESMDLEILVVKRLPGKKAGGWIWVIDGIEEEPLSKRQLSKFLFHVMRIPVHEIGFMHYAFKDRPDKSRAYFDIFGHFTHLN